jgi:hypothetical protein
MTSQFPTNAASYDPGAGQRGSTWWPSSSKQVPLPATIAGPSSSKMIERGCDGEHAFGLIVVHSYSRFFRVNASRSSNLSMMRRKATRPLPLGSVICRDSCV